MLDIIDISLIVAITSIITIFLIYTVLYSKVSKTYKIITVVFCISLVFLEVPHFMFQVDFIGWVFDITTHLVAGVTLFLLFYSLEILPKHNKELVALGLVFVSIVGIEIVLSILELTTTFINPIGINIIEDILWTTLGGLLGYAIVYTITD